jgi:DNA-binding transcriptional LysR family regulator
MHRLDWSDLQFILAVANNGSLAAAARALQVNHSTVQRRISSFEALHDVTVFDRRADGYKLTVEGQQLLEAARHVEQAVWGLERKIAGTDLKLEGTIRLTTTDTMLHMLLARHLKRFRERYPAIRFEVSTTNSLLSINRREADIAVRPAPAMPDGLYGKKACDFRLFIYASPAFAEANKAVAAGAMDWLAPGETLAGSTPGQWIRRSFPRANVVMTADTMMGLTAAAAEGLGAALLPSYVGDNHPGLVRLDHDTENAGNGVWVITHPDLANAARIHTFMDFICDALRDELEAGA